MNNDEKMMMTIVLTALILTIGLGLTAVYCVNHTNDSTEPDTGIDDKSLTYLVATLNKKGGTIYTDDGQSIVIPSSGKVVMENGLIMITNGGTQYVLPSRIVSVSF